MDNDTLKKLREDIEKIVASGHEKPCIAYVYGGDEIDPSVENAFRIPKCPMDTVFLAIDHSYHFRSALKTAGAKWAPSEKVWWIRVTREELFSTLVGLDNAIPLHYTFVLVAHWLWEKMGLNVKARAELTKKIRSQYGRLTGRFTESDLEYIEKYFERAFALMQEKNSQGKSWYETKSIFTR